MCVNLALFEWFLALLVIFQLGLGIGQIRVLIFWLGCYDDYVLDIHLNMMVIRSKIRALCFL